MAFNLRHCAICEICKKEQIVQARSEAHANEKLSTEHNWKAEGNQHVCDVCRVDWEKVAQHAG